MSTIGQYTSGMTGNYDTTTSNIAKTADSSKTSATSKSGSYGNTIGNVKLSDTAAKYYEELKNKYSGMDFVLVSDDETENAEQKAAQYANSGRTLVLIDASTVEKMATDEGVRAQYEGIIGNADAQLNEMAKSLASGVGANVKTFGIQVNSDGTTSYFAVVDKSISQQKERIEKNAEKRAEEKKAQKKEENEEWLDKIQEKSKENRAEQTENAEKANVQNMETLRGSSLEELIQKLTDHYMERLSDNARTEQELQLGTRIDFRL